MVVEGKDLEKNHGSKYQWVRNTITFFGQWDLGCFTIDILHTNVNINCLLVIIHCWNVGNTVFVYKPRELSRVDSYTVTFVLNRWDWSAISVLMYWRTDDYVSPRNNSFFHVKNLICLKKWQLINARQNEKIGDLIVAVKPWKSESARIPIFSSIKICKPIWLSWKKTDRCDISKGVGVVMDIEDFEITFISYTNPYPHTFLYNSNHVRLEDIQIV
jgi:hypothetical protein